MTTWRCGMVAWALGLGVVVAQAQLVQESIVQDSAGGIATGGGYSLVSSAAQPGGVRMVGDGAAAGVRHYAGFLGTFALRPDLDHDGDGLADEWAADNDGDGLEDGAELAGSDFATAWGVVAPTDLNAPDSDDDGAGDDHELRAGTNPNNADSLFAITDVRREGPGARVTWTGRGDGTGYRVLGRDGAYAPPTDELDVVVVADPGIGVWHTAEGTWLDEEDVPARYYGIEKQ